jgi:hypothetical protein
MIATIRILIPLLPLGGYPGDAAVRFCGSPPAPAVAASIKLLLLYTTRLQQTTRHPLRQRRGRAGVEAHDRILEQAFAH